ncbi:MAG: hypothetical protein V4732_00020 [Pseudomonadota bacterium]
MAAENDNTKNALAKAQYMLRQASTEKAGLEQQVTKQKVEIEKLTKEIALLKNESKSKLADISSNQSQVLTALNGDRQKVQTKLDNESRKNTELNSANELLTQKLAKQTNNFDICYGNNKKLYDINKEILGKYEDKGFWAALSQKEPFTAIEKVKVENLIQDYQYEIDNLTVKIVSDENLH